MTILDLLNDDLVDEILYRVPATSMKRLRATCKRWNRLFKDDRRFASEHCDKAPKEFLFLIATEEYRISPVSINLPHGDVPLYVEIKRELSLPDPYFNNSQFSVITVCHCDGLLLCTNHNRSRIVVWNPFTGQTRWIEVHSQSAICYRKFVLGYYYKQDKKNKSCSKRYKILCFDYYGLDIEIYELNSCDSWRRIPDGDLTPPGWYVDCYPHAVFLKGSCYFFGIEKSKPQHLRGLSLIRFDFSTEKSSLFLPLPCQRPRYNVSSLCVVREEKLSVFLQPDVASKAEIWVTSKIDETTKVKEVSWSKVLTLDLSPHLDITEGVRFLLDEDKKVAMCTERLLEDPKSTILVDKIYFLGEDNKVSEFRLGLNDSNDYEEWHLPNWPMILDYVPSLVQIELPAAGGQKRKRGKEGRIEMRASLYLTGSVPYEKTRKSKQSLHEEVLRKNEERLKKKEDLPPSSRSILTTSPLTSD